MSFEVDRYSSAWAHIALCADLTWAREPPDEFIIANQRLWAQHCRVAQVLQESSVETQSLPTNNQCELKEKRSNSSQIQENGSFSGRKSVKDVIPESRLSQHYGNFYYDDVREKCYTNTNERTNCRSYSGQGCENSDLTECWMLPEVEYWFRKLVNEPTECSVFPRRRRQYRTLADDDLSSERWGLAGSQAAGEEAALAARVQSVRGLWPSSGHAGTSGTVETPAVRRAPSPPPAPRKMRARRRQPRRLAALAPPPAFYLDAPAQLFCDPTCKFQFEAPRVPPHAQLSECQRAMGRLSASVQALMRASAARCQPYRGTNVTRYAPTCQRPRCPDRRYGVWWPRDSRDPDPRLDHRFHLPHLPPAAAEPPKPTPALDPPPEEPKEAEADEPAGAAEETEPVIAETETESTPETPESPKADPNEKEPTESQAPSTSAAQPIDSGLCKKRLYSTVLSMSAPAPLNLTNVGCVRLSQKLVTSGLIKLNPKIVTPTARVRPNVDNKFEELEKEALEQYKASDESIDTKFRELEKQAVEQYSNSNSNTSCSSGQSAEKRTSTSPVEADLKKKQAPKFHKEKAVDSVVIYSQNFPDLNAKGQTTSVTNLKNFHTPPRGEKKEQTHRSGKSSRGAKGESQRAASDTDYDTRETKGHKGQARWANHALAPKKRHLALCVSDGSSDEATGGGGSGALRDAAPRAKPRHAHAHGAGDLRPAKRNT